MNGKVPAIIQTQAIYALNNRVEANLNNLNKHCVPIEEAEDYLWSWSRVLKHIDDEIIMNSHNLEFCGKKFYVQELFMKINIMTNRTGFPDIILTVSRTTARQVFLRHQESARR